jgi:hypothetical protein
LFLYASSSSHLSSILLLLSAAHRRGRQSRWVYSGGLAHRSMVTGR